MPAAKILIVDDTKANLLALRVLLKPIQADIITADSGAQALEAAQQTEDNIALILLDVQMPVMDGFEVARLLHENEKTRSIPIIFITANQDDAHIEEAYLAGAVDYIQKPIRKTALISKVRVFLDLWWLRFGLEQEIEQRRAAEHRVEHLATHDPLTNLPNRRGLYEELNELIYRSQRYKFSSAVIYVDLDGFKNVNDHFGHEAGDRLLTQVSSNFKRIVRQTDSVARIGGDEFIVLITDIDGETSLITKIESLLRETSKPIEFKGHRISVGASIGVALFPEHGNNAETLLHHADQAMYQAKNEGKNTFRFFTEDINRKAHRQRELQDNLRKALPNDEFTVFFQPIVDGQTGQVVSTEALLRWYSAKLGQVFPDEFIPAAESAGLIPELGCWVLKKALATGAEWNQRFGVGLRIAVNASTIQFRTNLLFDTINEQIELHAWDPNLLEVEITEGLLLDDSPEVTTYITEINKRGVRLSVDDFGTGFSALSYLKNYPVSTVKIDRSFIMDLPGDKENEVLVQAIIAMAHGLRLEVIAEGVETAEQWEYLRTLGCDYVQGYYFGKPMPKSEFEDYLVAQLDKPALARF
ncbi:MAG: EAL domain-containing protein [Gammaproteobacteria bacterium]|nr:EAL domain-containing protein [Gammaproteobacteria bacterium]MDH3447503.1 EAL domain-containing protein [Gammaproteobacteria bacterium]